MKVRSHAGRVWEGPCGTATEIIVTSDRNVDHSASLQAWLLHCPGQSVAWDHYLLCLIHLRDIKGQSKPPTIRVPHATHEVMLVALDPGPKPTADDPESIRHLIPINVEEQFEVPSDELAVELLEMCVRAVLDGRLWAEPALSGQVEPWRIAVVRTSAHLRGEEHGL